ncbi:MAG: metallophosphoesterase family protein [Methanosarcinales archaeon]
MSCQVSYRFADVHANLHALNAVMEDAKSRGAEIFLNAGDFLGYGAFPDNGDRRVNYTILNIRSLSNNLIKVDYDIESVADSIRDM